MKNEVRFGHLLTLMAILVIPFGIWVKNVEVRSSNHSAKITQNSKDVIKAVEEVKYIREDVKVIQDKQNVHYINILKEISALRVDMQNKKNRD